MYCFDSMFFFIVASCLESFLGGIGGHGEQVDGRMGLWCVWKLMAGFGQMG